MAGSKALNRGRWTMVHGAGGHTNEVFIILDINEDCRKRDLEKIFSKYGPLKEIWLATYAPYYAFINYESKSDMEVCCIKSYMHLYINIFYFSTLSRELMERRLQEEE